MHQAKGAFEIQGTPLPSPDQTAGLSISRMSFQKQFSGELSGTSVLEMLGYLLKDLNSGAYVAMEKVTGQLQGRHGTFYLHHSSTMTRGVPVQSIKVVPDSGTDALTGLVGSMTIDIVGGKHFYTFDYTIPA